MKRILVKNGRIVKPDREFIGSIVVENGKIARILTEDMEVVGTFDGVVDATGMIVLPGFVNAHVHSYGNLVRGMTPAYPLEGWMLYIMAQGRLMCQEDCYWSALLGAIEMIKSGTTCLIDHLAQPAGGLDGAMAAYQKIGIRCVMAPMIADKGYFASLALDRARFSGGYFSEKAQSAGQLIETTESLLKKWHDPSGRLQVGFGPSGPQRCSDELLRLCGEKAKECDTIVHAHVLETTRQAVSARQLYGEDMVKHLDTLGLLNRRFCFAHGVALTDDEIQLVADRGSCLVHNPAVNFLLGSGVAPVDRYLRAHARVALGTDGANGSGNLNMFESMKDAAMIHNITGITRNHTDRWITPRQVLRMATETGAEACGLSGVTGCIAEGYSADLVLLDPMRSPRMSVSNDVYWQLAYTNPEECVDTVLICGNVVMQNRRLTLVDEAAVLREAARRADELQRRFENSELSGVLEKRWELDRYYSSL